MTSLVLFENTNFDGSDQAVSGATPQLTANISSLIVLSGTWNLYSQSEYQGQAWTVSANGGPTQNGMYPQFETYFANDSIASAQQAAPSPSDGEIILFTDTQYGGIGEPYTGSATNLGQLDNVTSSVIVGGGQWQLWTQPSYQGSSYIVGAESGPSGNGMYPTYEGYFPNDAIQSIKLLG